MSEPFKELALSMLIALLILVVVMIVIPMSCFEQGCARQIAVIKWVKGMIWGLLP